jgi:hypothetical protein
VTFVGFIPRRGIAVRFDRQIGYLIHGYLSGVGGGMQRRIPVLAAPNRCDSFRGIFVAQNVAAHEADGRAGTIGRIGQNSGVLQYGDVPCRIDPDRRPGSGARR